MTDQEIRELDENLTRWKTFCSAGAQTEVTPAQIALLQKLRPIGATDG